ncbi:MAG: tetratricopeptide repeat protein [Candidatus Nitrosopelagicus sp.]|jgi:Flp pilus assembly protein TadD|nr:tetratricopeptide repeat protein [Candidatus Nitrosopelagicus sp.]
MNIDELIKSGKKYLDEGNYNNALSFFDQALSIEPTNADLWNLKGIALRSLGRYDEASDCYNKSLEIEPRDTESS